MNYCTAMADKACKFSGHAAASIFTANGYAPEELPPSAQRPGETHGLRNVSGDWITDIFKWWDQFPAAQRAWRRAHERGVIAYGREADLSNFTRCGDDQCPCRHGSECPKEDGEWSDI